MGRRQMALRVAGSLAAAVLVAGCSNVAPAAKSGGSLSPDAQKELKTRNRLFTASIERTVKGASDPSSCAIALSTATTQVMLTRKVDLGMQVVQTAKVCDKILPAVRAYFENDVMRNTAQRIGIERDFRDIFALNTAFVGCHTQNNEKAPILGKYETGTVHRVNRAIALRTETQEEVWYKDVDGGCWLRIEPGPFELYYDRHSAESQAAQSK